MNAVMLAAGLGRRLFGRDDGSKALLSFDGESLLARHVSILRSRGIEQLMLVVGHQEEALLDEVARLGANDFIQPIRNPDYERGSLLSLWCARAAIGQTDEVLVMDADVLYHPCVIDRLIGSPHGSCLLLDQDFEPGEEPVKVAIRDGAVVDFGKRIDDTALDLMGEWPGFLKLSCVTGRSLITVAEELIDAGRVDDPMEEAVREVTARQPERFGWEDVTGLPWIEIDFVEDVARAEAEVLPRIEGRRARVMAAMEEPVASPT